jgi:signal transduction histidine kinase
VPALAQNGAMATMQPRLDLPRGEVWRRFAMRGVRTEGAALVIAVCLWAVFRQSFEVTLVYSVCISTMCWLFIDIGRAVVTSRLRSVLSIAASGGGQWPGWNWMLAIVVVGAVLGYASGNEIANLVTGRHVPGPFNANLQQTLSLLVMALVPSVMITYFFQSREVIATQRAEVERAEQQATEQRLKLLESQLEPHMLFNTLANLRTLIAVDPERAQAMLDRLIAFLRASLAGSRTGAQTLAAEFERLRDYLGLMEVRMGTRLATRFTLPDELAAAQIPPLLLQPIVENSIRHGLEPKREGGRIDVAAAREGDALVIRVRDTGAGATDALPSSGGGFGLGHVRDRLATLYGGAASFTLSAVDDSEGGMLATVRLPLTFEAARDAAPR